MGSRVTSSEPPRFRVRASGALVQAPGCPDTSHDGLRADRLEQLCRGECYNPTDEREPIDRIEVVRIQRQADPDEPLRTLIEDPWRTFECPDTPDGCLVEFADPEWRALDREVVYLRARHPGALARGERRCPALRVRRERQVRQRLRPATATTARRWTTTAWHLPRSAPGRHPSTCGRRPDGDASRSAAAGPHRRGERPRASAPCRPTTHRRP